MKKLAVALALAVATHVAHAATVTVTSVADGGPGSFRQALLDANAGVCAAPCRIDFDLGGPGAVIAPRAALPVITASGAEINGTLVNFSQPSVVLDGRDAGFVSGLKSSGASRINIHGIGVINFQGHGIFFDGGAANLVAECVIGIDARTGDAAPNGMNGLAARNVTGVVANNSIISANGGNGIYMIGCSDASMQNNSIGETRDQASRPNLGYGIFLDDTSNSYVDGNTIDHNALSGVGIYGDRSTVQVGIFNHIFDNGLLGIDLGGDGPTPNDPLDADLGPNELQNAPVIVSALRSRSSYQVEMTIETRPGAEVLAAIYEADAPNRYGAGQGKKMIGFTSGMTDAEGKIHFTFLATNVTSDYVTATVESSRTPTGRQLSSEFSAPVKFVDAGQTFTVTTTADSGPGSLRQAILDANAAGQPGNQLPSTIGFALPAEALAGPVYTIRPVTPLPAITAPFLVLDGLTQSRTAGDTNPAGPDVVLNGASCGGPCNGLELLWDDGKAGQRVVSGLTIDGFSGSGIVVRTLHPSPYRTGGTRIQACYIGTDPSGRTAVPNGGHGVDIADSSVEVGPVFNNGVDGVLTTDSGLNVISGNRGDGLHVASGSVVIAENRIGVTATGSEPLGNGGFGIWVTNTGVTTQAVSSVVSLRGGEIAFNGKDGVAAAKGSQVSFVDATIHDNGGLGIDLGMDGPTENDPGDVDGLQNAPVIASAVFDPGTGETVVSGTLDAERDGITSWQVVTLFSNPYPDPSGRGEGSEKLVALRSSSTTSNRSWTTTIKGDLSGKFLTATAVRFDGFIFANQGATSEFSEAVQVKTVLCGGHASPVGTGPLNGAEAGKPVTFSWTDAGAPAYALWIRPAQQKAVPQPFTEARSTTVTLAAGDYEWFVQASFPLCYSTYSLPQKLTVR